MPYAANGNAKPARVYRFPHQAWGLAPRRSTTNSKVKAEISMLWFSTAVKRRRRSSHAGHSSPKTRLADPHGIYWDDTHGEIGVASHGNFRGSSQNGRRMLPRAQARGGAQRERRVPATLHRYIRSGAKDDQAPVRTIEGDSAQARLADGMPRIRCTTPLW